jgi:hypothetical protein
VHGSIVIAATAAVSTTSSSAFAVILTAFTAFAIATLWLSQAAAQLAFEDILTSATVLFANQDHACASELHKLQVCSLHKLQCLQRL